MTAGEQRQAELSMKGQIQHLAEALECCKQIRMEAERMINDYQKLMDDFGKITKE